MLAGCGFVFLRDVDAGKASDWLNALRRPRRVGANCPPMPDVAAEATRLGCSALTGAGLRPPSSGMGSKRTGTARRDDSRGDGCLPCRTRRRGTGPATINHYVRAVRGFFRWLVRLEADRLQPARFARS